MTSRARALIGTDSPPPRTEQLFWDRRRHERAETRLFLLYSSGFDLVHELRAADLLLARSGAQQRNHEQSGQNTSI